VPVPPSNPFDYAVVRVVPRVEREEFLNAGVIVFCLTQNFLAAKVAVADESLLALWPELDLEDVNRRLQAIPLVCRGGKEAGPIGALSQRERFQWLVSPRSTIIQVSPVHTGLCDTPEMQLEHLFTALVSRPK